MSNYQLTMFAAFGPVNHKPRAPRDLAPSPQFSVRSVVCDRTIKQVGSSLRLQVLLAALHKAASATPVLFDDDTYGVVVTDRAGQHRVLNSDVPEINELLAHSDTMPVVEFDPGPEYVYTREDETQYVMCDAFLVTVTDSNRQRKLRFYLHPVQKHIKLKDRIEFE